jgi:predicted ATP-dependent endonuclease of OLD family
VARLFILVEGETEETFVNELLAPHLYETAEKGAASTAE